MARLFNGTSDLAAVNAAHLTNAGIAFTVAAWIKSASAVAGQEVYGEGNTGAVSPFFQVAFSAGGTTINVAARASGSGAADTLTGAKVVSDGVWHPVCVTQTAANLMALFVDGVADGTLTRTAASNAAGQTFNTATIGALVRSTTGSFFTGSVAHLATWSRQLSAAEVASLAEGVSPLQFTPDHYWPLYGLTSSEPDGGTATNTPASLTGTTSTVGPAATDLASFIASWGRRPVPMIKGPDTDKLLGMRGIYH